MKSRNNQENRNEQQGFLSNRHNWPMWKWILFGVGTLILLAAVVFGAIVTFGAVGVAIAAAIGGAGFVSVMSAAAATCVSILTHVVIMPIVSAGIFLLNLGFIFILKNDKPLPMSGPKVAAPKDIANKPQSDLSSVAKAHKGLGSEPVVQQAAPAALSESRPALVIDTNVGSEPKLVIEFPESPTSLNR